MDPSKSPQGSDEGGSNESGWTAYIGSPHRHTDDHNDDDDEEEERKERDAESDDSMASDASSAPRDSLGHFNKQFACGNGKSTNQRKNGGKKEQKQHGEKIKAGKDKADCAARSRKK